MKKTLIIFLFLLVFSGCEKDDICPKDAPTSPQLIIEFFDFANPNASKNITNLKLRVAGSAKELPLTTAFNKVKIPLKSNEDVTNMELILNFVAANPQAGTPESGNSDELTFNYTRQFEYISKACGYKALFQLDPNPVNAVQLGTVGVNWIKNIVIAKTFINNETDTHVKIYF